MHAPYDKPRSDSTETKRRLGFFILAAIVAVVLTVLTALRPQAATWIAQAVEAEYADGFAADKTVETAQPGMVVPLRTVHAY
jgi:hypothetical protein